VGDPTALLKAWEKGDLAARDELLPLVYGELRRRAAAYLRRERSDHTLQPTALVHEAFMRLMDQRKVSSENRTQFISVAAQMMGRVLIDHARAHHAAKRPAAALQVTLDAQIPGVEPRSCDLLLLDRALADLAEFDPGLARIVELRYFGGLSEQEVADLLGTSRSTVTREWQTARAWLSRRMTEGLRRGPSA
jgi:RNA polymerase sigma factor (TIGR02999 family)